MKIEEKTSAWKKLAIWIKISNLNTEVLIDGMSSRSLHTVRSFWVNNCYCVVMISIFLHKIIPSNDVRNISCISSFIPVVEELAHGSTWHGICNAKPYKYSSILETLIRPMRWQIAQIVQ
jgi:hypothetical protein